MAIRVALSIVLVVLSVFTNRSFLGWGLFAVLAVLVVPYGRARSFLRAFVPYAAVWFLFGFLRSFADETRQARIVNTNVAKLERWLFNGELPSIRLQVDFYSPGELNWWDFYFTFVHWSYFIIPHAVAVWLWWRNQPRFRHYLSAMTILLTLGLITYFAIPSNPPWMAPESVNSPGAPTVLRIMEPIARQLGGGLYQASYKVVGESNPIAAMPSIHFAITFLLVWVAANQRKRWRILAWTYALSMGIALVYMGEHYVIDIIAGGAVTSAGWMLARIWTERVSPSLIARRITRPGWSSRQPLPS
jgi:membrane-associated phospholipid phosphatase